MADSVQAWFNRALSDGASAFALRPIALVKGIDAMAASHVAARALIAHGRAGEEEDQCSKLTKHH
jgi:hypothetical protein